MVLHLSVQMNAGFCNAIYILDRNSEPPGHLEKRTFKDIFVLDMRRLHVSSQISLYSFRDVLFHSQQKSIEAIPFYIFRSLSLFVSRLWGQLVNNACIAKMSVSLLIAAWNVKEYYIQKHSTFFR